MSLKNRVSGLGLAAFLGMQALLPNKAKADLNRNISKLESITGVDYSKRKTNLLELGAYCLGSYGLTIFIHEEGHYLAGLALGAEDLETDFVPKKDGDGFVFASVKKKGLSENEEIIFSLAGVGTTRISYEVLNYYLKSDKVPDNFERFSSVLALFLRADLPRGIIFSSLRYYTNNESNYSDIHNVVNNNFDKKERGYVYGGLLLAEGIDLYLDRKEIKNHFYRALGKPVSKPEKDDKVDLNFDFGKDRFVLGLEYNF